MISNPKNGWYNFKLGDFVGTPSYLINVPVELLKGFITYFKMGATVMWFDEEGTEFTFVANPYSTFIIAERKENKLYDLFEINMKDAARELIDDIKRDFKGWCEFVIADEDVEEQK